MRKHFLEEGEGLPDENDEMLQNALDREWAKATDEDIANYIDAEIASGIISLDERERLISRAMRTREEAKIRLQSTPGGELDSK